LDDKTGTPQSAQDSDAAIEKELATIEHAQPSTPADAGATKAAKLGGTPSEAGGRAESMLERQSGTPKLEPKWNEGDSVESLWGAVQAGSVSAEVSLAERFARGAGVSKNCDQAKVLMKAAAERGSKEARFRLYQMETQGCR
jgi:TPR repeat protein